MFDMDKTQRTVQEFNDELADAMDQFRAGCQSLKKVIGWLPGYVQYAIMQRIQEEVDCEVNTDLNFHKEAVSIEYAHKPFIKEEP